MLKSQQNITELKDNEVFVFGSNAAGQHYGGAARFAHDKFGAMMGVGIGPTGRCYAIPTMGDIQEIELQVDVFLSYASIHENKTFLVTEIGCGIAGFTPTEIAPFFQRALFMDNVALPQRFIDVLLNKDEA